MNPEDARMVENNWTRMREALARAARDYRRVADELEAINFQDSKGIRRATDAIISQAALTSDSGRINADMIHRLAIWAETINELERRYGDGRPVCDHTITDPDIACILTAGHSWPKNDGLTAHMSASGVMFA